MDKSKVGLIALAVALGSSANAELSSADKSEVEQRIGQLNSVETLVSDLENSQSQTEYEAKIAKIKETLKSLTKEEQKKLTQGAIRCAL